MLLLGLLAALGGAETFVDIARFGEKKVGLLRRFRPLRDGTPWQFSDRFVAGLEADLQGAGVRGGGGFTNLTPAAVYPPFIAATRVTVHRSLEYFGTVRGRLGYAVTPTLLFYATGGLAYGGIATSTAVNQSLTPSLLLSAGAKSDFFNNRAGWTVGGGVESALTGELSAKLEFLYYDLGVANVAFPNSGLLIQSTWLVTSLSPNSDKMSKHSIAAGDAPKLLALLARLRGRAEQFVGGSLRRFQFPRPSPSNLLFRSTPLREGRRRKAEGSNFIGQQAWCLR